LPFAFGPPPENSGLVGRGVCVAAGCFPLGSRYAGVAGCAVRASVKDPIYYVAGPLMMVTAMKDVLTGAGVNEDDLRAEDFGGY